MKWYLSVAGAVAVSFARAVQAPLGDTPAGGAGQATPGSDTRPPVTSFSPPSNQELQRQIDELPAGDGAAAGDRAAARRREPSCRSGSRRASGSPHRSLPRT